MTKMTRTSHLIKFRRSPDRFVRVPIGWGKCTAEGIAASDRVVNKSVTCEIIHRAPYCGTPKIKIKGFDHSGGAPNMARTQVLNFYTGIFFTLAMFIAVSTVARSGSIFRKSAMAA